MKSLLLFLLWASFATSFAQDQLFLKDGRVIEPIQLHEIRSISVVYVHHSSLHEIYKSEVRLIKNDTTTLYFDEKGETVYVYRARNPEAKSLNKPLLTPRQGSLFWVPSDLISIRPSILVGVEIPINSRWSIVQEGGMIFGLFWEEKITKSWQSRSKLRRYHKSPFLFFHQPGRIYLEGEFCYQSWHSNRRLSSQSQTSYSYTNVYATSSLSTQTGLQWTFPSRLMVEVWGGIGIQHIKEDRSSEWMRFVFPGGLKLGIAL